MRAVATGWARSTRRRYAGAMALAVLCLMLSEGPGRAAPTRQATPVHDPWTNWEGYGHNWLNGVKALAPDDVWIVGNHMSDSHEFQPVMRHFDGTSWTRMGRLGHVGSDRCVPTGVDALSDQDVWLTCRATAQPMVYHWDGSSWQLQDIAQVGVTKNLFHVWADTKSDVWAVGDVEYIPGGIQERALVEHFNGRRWTRPELPEVGRALLFGVDGTSPTDVWVVGHHAAAGSDSTALVMHYDGTSWTVADLPDLGPRSGLESVSAVSPDDVWATGWSQDGAVALHWDGTSWTDTGADISVDTWLFGVSAISPDDVWAVGAQLRAPVRAVAIHWDGHVWTSVPPLQPGHPERRLLAVSADSGQDVWAVGYRLGGADWVRMYQRWDGSGWVRHTPP